MRPFRVLLLVSVSALILRLILLSSIQHPGIGDPNHYFNLGVQLVEGKGFNIDYIWQYVSPPSAVVHPEDHWMPLTGILAYSTMLLFGKGVHVALIPFIFVGTVLIPIVTYLAARQFQCSQNASLLAAAFSAFLPEFVLNSLRTDTTLPNVVFICSSIVLFTRGLREAKAWHFGASGVFTGLAYLTRNDAVLLLPVLFLTVVVYRLQLPKDEFHPPLKRHFLLYLITAAVVISPWIIRNVMVLGTPTTRELDRMLFFTDTLDHWAYAREFSLQTLLAAQTPMQIIGKRLFELAAAAKLMYTTLDIFLPVAVAGGCFLLVYRRDQSRLLLLAPTLFMILATLIAYPILVPYKSQAGSFKKAYLTILPMLIPVGTYAVECAVSDIRLRVGGLVLAVIFTAANAFELVRADTRFTNNYLGSMQRTSAIVQGLPDTNGDNKLILMAQDPFMLRFVGVQSVMIPFESREKILEVAARYNVDYLLMPADRPSLDLIYLGEETDSHIRYVTEVHGTPMKLYRIDNP